MVKIGRVWSRAIILSGVDSEAGQGVMEYILLLAVVVFFFMIVKNGLSGANIAQSYIGFVQKDFHYAYQYGDPSARGYADGGPTKHPRARRADDPTGKSFRIFINPAKGKGL